ncbi:cystathionine gamma-lyase-like [Artemia franciscana]|uniref:cystathionine gamma-lyase-like n=1 Tax=Artemia franciscana TaxID=6661 RepID=UPI0032DB7878
MSMENGVVHSGFKEQSKDFATRALHDGQEPEQWESRAVVPPICLSTTFKQDGPAQHRGFEYGRSGNPTRNVLEAALASLESAKYALTFASGLAATTTITQMFSNGDHIVSMDDLYGGTNRYLRQVADRLGITTTFVDAAVPENVQKAVQPNTKLVWIETPTNPLMKLVDIGKIAKITHAAGAILVVDNTFMSSYFQRPLELGADIVMHSLTKYMNGHSDVIMGAAMTSDEEIHKKLRFLQNAIGAVPSPFDCYLVNRSLKTLHLRMRQHMENGIKVAKFLESHPLVEKVIFPGKSLCLLFS